MWGLVADVLMTVDLMMLVLKMLVGLRQRSLE